MFKRLRASLWLWPLVLLAVVLLLWARSYLPEYSYIRSYRGHVAVLFLSGTYVQWLDEQSGQFAGTARLIHYSRQVAQQRKLPQISLLGFEWNALNFKSSFPGFILIPYWAIAAVLALLSIWMIVRRRQQRPRSLPGHCRECGYDLRGSEGSCPECGAGAVARKSSD
jgi:hypothetical protein